MKIAKGYTHEQFIDLLQTKDDYFMFEYGNRYDIERFRIICGFNEFCKQKPTKEMFVNPFKKPFNGDIKYMTIWDSYTTSYDFDEDTYEKDLKEWQEAEKKVIFKNWKISKTDKGELILNFNNKYELLLKQYGVYINKGNDYYEVLDSLSQLFTETNGELEINIES